MWNQKPSFRFEIETFSEKEVATASKTFVSGGCEWYLNLHPKGDGLCDDHLSLYLCVANPKSLGRGWKRSVNYYFVMLNQYDKELYRSPVQTHTIFREKAQAWGFRKTLPLTKFEEKGFLEKDRLIIEVYINIVEAFDEEGGDVSGKKETMDINGFQVLASQAPLVRKIFAEHPDLAEDFKPKNQVVKTTYMNILLTLIEELHQPSQNHSETELSTAHRQLRELVEMGFKLDWLKSKLDEVTLERKKSDDADESRVQQLEERIKNLELMELDFKLDSLKTKLDEVSLQEKKKADADWSRVQQLEETVKNLATMVSDLKLELDKEKAKSSDDGFLLVNEVA